MKSIFLRILVLSVVSAAFLRAMVGVRRDSPDRIITMTDDILFEAVPPVAEPASAPVDDCHWGLAATPNMIGDSLGSSFCFAQPELPQRLSLDRLIYAPVSLAVDQEATGGKLDAQTGDWLQVSDVAPPPARHHIPIREWNPWGSGSFISLDIRPDPDSRTFDFCL